MIAGDTFGSRSDDPGQRFAGPTLEGRMGAKGGGPPATVVIARQGARGLVSRTPYALLHTLGEGWDLPPLGRAAARPMLEFFR